MDLSRHPVRAPIVRRAYDMKFGAELQGRGVRFRLWAPACSQVWLRLESGGGPDRCMPRSDDGWFEHEEPNVGAGTRYHFVLPDGTCVPDPASRYQPEDVHGPSEVVDPRAYGWRDAGWRGRPWEEAVIYELHVGAFTRAGTFAAVIERLDDLDELGVTAIELMPIGDFPGRWNWGYDGVLPFAPDSSYGRPDDLKALVDAAHARSMMVFLDVVYNHFGPDGNFMPLYAPVLTDKHHTPWGRAVNFDDEGSAIVREFVVANARYWLEEFHFDGLRFDAVHAIKDDSPRHLLEEMADELRASANGRHIHLVLENDKNESAWLPRTPEGTPRLYTAQWNDDVHHTLHSAATDEADRYYADYHGRPELIGRALAEGFAYQGETMPCRPGARGQPSAHLPPTAFVAFIQNHDQIGNRAFGHRLGALAKSDAVRALAVIYLLFPQIPLIFMGEEWAAPEPFLYFADFGGELADKIRDGRRNEFQFASHVQESDQSLPDPVAEVTFLASKLDWDNRRAGAGTDWLSLYRTLLGIRRTEIVPRLKGIGGHAGAYEVLAGRGVKVSWRLADGAVLQTIANLSPEPLDLQHGATGRTLWPERPLMASRLDPWGVVVSLTAHPDYMS